jgi:hypothetical protein
VAGYLHHLAAVGFTVDGSAASPRFLGLDSQGRDVLSFLPGDVPGARLEARALTDVLLASVGRLVVGLHAASAGFDPRDEPSTEH